MSEVRFDARPFEYRRPTYSYENHRQGEKSRHSYDYLDPLYKYSEGRVTDAARRLGISNVNNPDKANRILTELQTDPKGRQAYQQHQTRLQATASKTQADIAKQLKIVQAEKSAVSKMTQDYTDMLKIEADKKLKAEEEAKGSYAAYAANQMRQSQAANLQIQPASYTPQTAGTTLFKKRPYNQFMTGISGMVNI